MDKWVYRLTHRINIVNLDGQDDAIIVKRKFSLILKNWFNSYYTKGIIFCTMKYPKAMVFLNNLTICSCHLLISSI